MTKQIDILSTQTSDTKSLKSASTTANKEVKQEASLFDKLLFENVSTSDKKNEISNKKSKVDSATPANTKNTDVNVNSQDKIEKNIQSEEDNKNISTPNKSTSLLDRLILEAKKNTDNGNSLENEKDTNGSKIGNLDNTKENITKVNTKIEDSSEKEEIKLDIKANDVKNTNVDLSKNLVEVNTKIEDSSEKDETKLDGKTNDIKSNYVKNINIDTSKNIVSENTVSENTKNTIVNKTVESNEETKNLTLQNTKIEDSLKNKEIKLDTKTNDVKNITVDTVKNTISVNTETTQNTNTKLAKDLASLNTDVNNKNTKINITKDEIESLPTKQKEEPKSLMDSLIEKTKNVKNQVPMSEEDSKTLKNSIDSISSDNSSKIMNSKSVLNNIYLSSQQNNINNNALSTKAEAITAVKNASTIQEIEVNAKKLDLNIKEINLETKNSEIKQDSINLMDRKTNLDMLALNNNARHNEFTSLITKSVEASKAILDDTSNFDNEVTLNVNASLAQSIQTKIIGARQQMSSMMSEVARKMYENYQPPVTAFRINLNPANLGNIAITMKSTKDNGINISLNISNTATLDAFIDSQSSLKNALNKTFEDGSSFNLDFSSSDNQNNDKSNNQEDTDNSFINKSDTQTILESREKNLESEDRNTDYM